MDKQKRRDELVTKLQEVERQLIQLGTARSELRGAIVAYDEQIAAETAPRNRAERRRKKSDG